MKQFVILFMSLVLFTSCKNIMDLVSDWDGEYGYLVDFLGPEDPPFLDMPDEFLASKAGYSDRVVIQWDSVASADYYELEKSFDPSGPFIDMGIKIYTNSYSDTTVESGTNVWYRLRAYSRVWDLYSTYTEIECGYLLSAPTGVRASKGESTENIYLVWDLVPGASAYDIYRSSDKNIPNNPLQSVSGIEDSVEISISESGQGIEYYFWIRSRNSRGSLSEFSLYSMGFALPEGAPPKPENLVAGQGLSTNEINLNWTENSLAEYYIVYRWSDYNSQEEIISRTDTLTGTSFLDNDQDALKSGARYYYAIQAVKKDEVDENILYKSAFSDTAEGYLLSPPMDLGSRWNDDAVDITWSGVPGVFSSDEIAGHNSWQYRIEYGSSIAGPFSVLATVSVTETDGSGNLLYQHNSATAPVFYRIITLNGPVESDSSSVDEPVTGPVTSFTASMNGQPLSGETANGAGVFPVHLNWTKPEGAVACRVERATKENGKYLVIGTTMESAYIDDSSSFNPCAFYYYQVVPLNSLGKEGDTSGKIPGYGAITDPVFLTEYNENAILTSQEKLTLMHNGGLDALGNETKNGDVSGTVYYKATGGLSGAEVIMKFTNYCDNTDDSGNGNFMLNGNSDTIITSVSSQNGYMRGTVSVSGMYPGSVYYENMVIKGGAAGGGTYGVEQTGRSREEIDWTLLQ